MTRNGPNLTKKLSPLILHEALQYLKNWIHLGPPWPFTFTSKNLKSAPHYNFVSFLQKKEKEKKYKPSGEYRKWVPISALLTVTDTYSRQDFMVTL